MREKEKRERGRGRVRASPRGELAAAAAEFFLRTDSFSFFEILTWSLALSPTITKSERCLVATPRSTRARTCWRGVRKREKERKRLS